MSNFRREYGEIDIIAIHKNVLVFVEVKTRTSESYGTAFEAITPWKMRPLVKTTQYYAMVKKLQSMQMRMDAIGVSIDPDTDDVTIEQIENISY